MLQTTGGSYLLITDEPGPQGGIVLRSPAGSTSITVNDTGIVLVSGAAKITLTQTTVDINDSALSIT